MCSARADDLTAMARIRDAALELFAAEGFATTTLRAIAERAGVSAALVVHHYGSKDGLRRACDEYLIGYVRTEKTQAVTSPQPPDIRAYLAEHPEFSTLTSYLLRVLREGGPAADHLFDRMCHDTHDYLALGEAAGTIRPYADQHARAVISTAMGFGLMLFEEAVAQRLGGTSLADPPVVQRYADFTLDLYTHGMLTQPGPRQEPRRQPPQECGVDDT
ncbi:MAG: TetR family transcriptional regulator [Austwickia sp.]|jgi:AcrR family transcriptional regulator|nr:TetR family transcriptional regulator [Austwickia sp.]MBK8437345.1 TetR family transcriptional regulator [Austwickia sp.]MBK9102586.1 TetR family transcriptional regulator [Austwickia sp.]